MSIAAELHKTEDDVAGWPLSRIVEWNAFFRLREKWTKEAVRKDKRLMSDEKPGSIVEHL
jgi:hypothetical protein